MNASRWMEIAKQELGVCEISGIDHNDRIITYHGCTTLRATRDEVPWCSSFVCWVLKQAGVAHTKSAASLSYLEWGQEIYVPRYGAIAVFERGKGKGHVGFVFSDTPKTINVLGGNQGNQVKVSPYSKDRLISLRWPDESQILDS